MDEEVRLDIRLAADNVMRVRPIELGSRANVCGKAEIYVSVARLQEKHLSLLEVFRVSVEMENASFR